MLLHTSPSTGVLQIFPGIPSGIDSAWADVAFHRLRASGGLLVSAHRIAGETDFIRLEAEQGGDYLIQVAFEPAWTQMIPRALPDSIQVSKPAVELGVSTGV